MWDTSECREHYVNNCELMLSSEYGTTEEQTYIQHSACLLPGHQWQIKLKIRRKNSHTWYDPSKICNNYEIIEKHNDIHLRLASPSPNLVVAAFGCYGSGDCKRMQLAVFGKRTSPGKIVYVMAYLLDDTTPAFQGVCRREKGKGNQLLAPMSSVLLSAVNADVRLTMTKISNGWRCDGQDTKVLHFSKVWNSQSSAVPPHCSFVLKQTDVIQKSWVCQVTLQHNTETARVETSGNIKEEPMEQHNDKSYSRKLPKRGKCPWERRS